MPTHTRLPRLVLTFALAAAATVATAAPAGATVTDGTSNTVVFAAAAAHGSGWVFSDILISGVTADVRPPRAS